MSVVLPPDLADRVERLAQDRGETMTKTVVRLLEAGERSEHEGVRADALSVLHGDVRAMAETIRAEVRRDVKDAAHRLSHLLAKTALESMATRSATGAVLMELYGGSRERAARTLDTAWTSAVDRLKNPSAGVRESLNALIAGSGELDPGAALVVRDAADALREQVGNVRALVAEVQSGRERDAAGDASLKKMASQLDAVAQSVQGLQRQLLAWQAEQDAKKSRGFFGNRG